MVRSAKSRHRRKGVRQEWTVVAYHDGHEDFAYVMARNRAEALRKGKREIIRRTTEWSVTPESPSENWRES